MHELEARLEAAAPYYAFPETPDLAGAARARLTHQGPRSRTWLALAFAVALAVVAGAVLALSPGARSGLVDLLDRVPGIHIERSVSLPEVPYGQAPYYGVEMPLDEAQGHFGQRLRLPKGVGDPDHVYWLQYPPGDMITAEYGAENGGAKLVFSQWKTGGPDLFYKTLSFNTTAEPAVVDGNPGLWISGGDHAVFYLAPEDTGTGANHWSQRGYLAGNVLAWRDGDVIYRLEADVPKEEAIEIAESLEER
jgi:Domain of unknown function (DUF4367)